MSNETEHTGSVKLIDPLKTIGHNLEVLAVPRTWTFETGATSK
jgi:hypothetical protein